MAEAILKGMLQQGIATKEQIAVADIAVSRLTQLQELYGVEVVDSAAAVAELLPEVLFLAVKPQQFPEVLSELKPSVQPEHTLVVSIAAGISTRAIEQQLQAEVRVVRVMPNTPALVGCGAAAVCRGANATDADVKRICAVFDAVGLAVEVNESEMDAVTAVSGSGPAYVFYVIEAMQAAAEQLGLERADTLRLILQTFRGAVQLCEKSGEDAAVLRQRVTSKGGTTAAALQVLNNEHVDTAFVAALNAAAQRSCELSALV